MGMKRRRVFTCAGENEVRPSCPRSREGLQPSAHDVIDSTRIRAALAEDGVRLSDKALEHFVFHIDRSARIREGINSRWAERRLKRDDIIRLIIDARDGGDGDEAVWRALLGAHFGRDSA